MHNTATVFVVDDDAAMRDSLRWLVESIDLPVRTFKNAAAFLDEYSPDQPGCLVVDVRMPGMSGLELQEQLIAREISLPVIVISGHADVPMAVRAMKGGAVDFLQKPFDDQVLIERINNAIGRDRRARQNGLRQTDLAALFDRLTPREREVMELVVSGKANKQIAAILDRSEKTVEHHRAHVMRKMEAGSLAELVKLRIEYGAATDGTNAR